MDMSQAWRFKAHFIPYILDTERVLLRAETQPSHLLRGQLYVRLAPLLDGSLSADQIVAALQGDVSAAMVYYALLTLAQKGYLASATDRLPWPQQVFWEGLGVEAVEAAARLAKTSVAIMPIGDTAADAAALAAALSELAIPVAGVEAAALVIAVVEDYLQPDLAALHQRLHAAATPWMAVKPVGHTLWLGPLFTADSLACWECLTRRLRDNRLAELGVPEPDREPLWRSQAALPTTRQAAVQLAATELARWAVCGDHDSLRTTLVTVALATLAVRHHRLHRHPACEVCGASDRQQAPGEPGAAPIVLQSRPKRFTADGGHRACPPEETLARLEPLISPLTGVLPEVVKAAGVEISYVFHAVPFGASGKGATETQARVSCLAEAVELYNGCFQGNEPRRTARYADLREDAIHPNRLLHVSERQYAAREAWNRILQGPKAICPLTSLWRSSGARPGP